MRTLPRSHAPATLGLAPGVAGAVRAPVPSADMADQYTSRIALLLDAPLDDVGEVVAAATRAGDVDRHAPVAGQGHVAQEVNWGGRMQKAVVRQLTEDDDTLLRTETYVGTDGLVQGMTRQARLVQALSRQLSGRVTGVRDLSAMADRDLGWVNRLAIGAVEHDDAIRTVVAGTGTHWVHTFGAARFDVPDLELYGLSRAQVPGARDAIAHVHAQLLADGLRTQLSLPSGEPVYLVPVLEAWQHLNGDWPGVGHAGQDRGPGLDGPRATLSILHPARFGRFRKDFRGVLAALPISS